MGPGNYFERALRRSQRISHARWNRLSLGDGGLNYRREKVIETYYTFKLWRAVYLSADVQRVWDPGYNRDRGPALVGAIRLHFEGIIFTPH
jgi:carbohydrate-selective porin OprB